MSAKERNANLRALNALDDDISQAKKDLMLRFVKDQEALQTSHVDLKTVDDETLDLMDNISVSTATMPEDKRTTQNDLKKRVSSRRSAKTRVHTSSSVNAKVESANAGHERAGVSAQRGVKAALVRHPRSPSATSLPPSSRKIYKLSSSPLDNEDKNTADSLGRLPSGKQANLLKNEIKTVTKISSFKSSASGAATYVKVQNEAGKSPVKALYRPKSSYMLRHMQSALPEEVEFGAKRISSAGVPTAKGDDLSTVLQLTRNQNRTKIGIARPSSRGRNVKLGSFEQVDIESINSKDLKVLNCTGADSNVGPYKLVQKHQLPPIAHEASPAPTPPV